MKIVVKVGSNAILTTNGEPLIDVMSNIIQQITELQQKGHQTILVSSGAVALGRALALKISGKKYGVSVADKQLLASIGQPQLMAIYAKICESKNFVVAQLLLTKYDFQTKRSYTNILRLLQKYLSQNQLLTIVNENDSVAIDELMFTDNDELAGIIAAQIGADKLIILSTIDGIYDKNPSEPDATLITELHYTDPLPDVSGKSSFGRGGMSSKLNTARKMAKVGVMTHIANINEINAITQIVLNNANIGSKMIPNTKYVARKKYLAFNTQTTPHGQITINWCLVKILSQPHHSISILPVGIESYNGDFKRGDLIDIMTPKGDSIGVGIARYNSNKLIEYLGGKNHPALIHYDYLYIN